MTNNIPSQKFYEIAFLVKDPIVEKAVVNLLNQYKVNVLYKSSPTETKLAYPIKKYSEAYFNYIQFESEGGDILNKIKASLKLNPAVLRFLIVKLIKKQPALEDVRERSDIKKYPRVEPFSKTVLTNEALEEKLEEILK